MRPPARCRKDCWPAQAAHPPPAWDWRRKPAQMSLASSGRGIIARKLAHGERQHGLGRRCEEDVMVDGNVLRAMGEALESHGVTPRTGEGIADAVARALDLSDAEAHRWVEALSEGCTV